MIDDDDHCHPGTDGDDLLTGAGAFHGLGGNDTVHGSFMGDLIYGGTATRRGDGPATPAPDGEDWLHGAGGNDSINGLNDDDHLFGGAGNDSLADQQGRDVLRGGAGNDSLTSFDGNDRMSGGDGHDVFHIDDGFTGTLRGGGGIDTVYVTLSGAPIIRNHPLPISQLNLPGATIEGVEFVVFLATAGTMVGSAGDDDLALPPGVGVRAGAGDDWAVVEFAAGGTLALRGGQGQDHLSMRLEGAAEGITRIDIRGRHLTDGQGVQATGFETYSLVHSGSNAFDIRVQAERASIYLGDGDDIIRDGRGESGLTGSGGDDRIFGGGGDDGISGGDGQDRLFGGAGSDGFELRHDDIAFGGAGADAFRFYDVDGTIPGTRIADFGRGGDSLHLDLLPGAVEFRWGPVRAEPLTTESPGLFLDARTNGSFLMWDPDGTGAAAAQAIVFLRGVSELTEGEVIVT